MPSKAKISRGPFRHQTDSDFIDDLVQERRTNRSLISGRVSPANPIPRQADRTFSVSRVDDRTSGQQRARTAPMTRNRSRTTAISQRRRRK